METIFEEQVQSDLWTYLGGLSLVDERMPECPDVEEKWDSLLQAYLPDGMREYRDYPLVSLGWTMFLGMAVAKCWDEDWADYGRRDNLYASLRDVRGFDCMDEYILEDVLKLDAEACGRMSRVVGECAARTESLLRRSPIEPGTRQAFDAYVACLHQLYRMGMAVWLHAMGYRMRPAQLG